MVGRSSAITSYNGAKKLLSQSCGLKFAIELTVKCTLGYFKITQLLLISSSKTERKCISLDM